MRDFSKEIAEIVKRIPENAIQCEPGCTDCCNRHAWSWAEWKRVDKKHHVNHMDSKCSYITESGCKCYDQRPTICRLFGLADGIGSYGPFEDVTLKCPRGVEPTTKLSKQEARSIFLAATRIRDAEAKFRIRSGAWPIFAGPYGRLMSDAYAKGQMI